MTEAATGLPSRVPYHLAIIMDGNGRWAKSRGLPRVAGHRAGVENLRRVLRACSEFGVKILTIYAFSTELTIGFPLVNYSGATWSSRFSHLWPLAAVVRWRHDQRQAAEPASEAERARMQEIEAFVLEAVIEDLGARPPDLVFVEYPHLAAVVMGYNFDYISYFSRDPRFRKIWANYRKAGSTRRADYFLRSEGVEARETP